MARQKRPCGGWCIFKKSKASKKYPRGRWRRVYSDPCKGHTPPRPPSNSRGQPGESYLCHCLPVEKAMQSKTVTSFICFGSCQWHLMADGVTWDQDTFCPGNDPNCVCPSPPPGLPGTSPGAIYLTLCGPPRMQ